MQVIKWNEKKPEGQNMPAATGTFLDSLIVAKVYWENCKGYFQVTFTGNKYETFPEQFDTLQEAKEFAEKKSLSILLAATEKESHSR